MLPAFERAITAGEQFTRVTPFPRIQIFVGPPAIVRCHHLQMLRIVEVVRHLRSCEIDLREILSDLFDAIFPFFRSFHHHLRSFLGPRNRLIIPFCGNRNLGGFNRFTDIPAFATSKFGQETANVIIVFRKRPCQVTGRQLEGEQVLKSS